MNSQRLHNSMNTDHITGRVLQFCHDCTPNSW
jgi:hypothetical protein